MQLADLLVAIGIDTEELTRGADDAANEVEGSLKGIDAAAAGAVVGGLFVAGLNSAMDASAANARLTQQLGLTKGEAQRAGKDAGAVFRAGFGESIDEVNDALGSVVSSLGGMGELSDQELQSMTTSALRLSDVYEIDVADAAQTAGQMINSGLAKDGKEAFDILTRAAQKLPKAMVGDIPDVVNEYGKSWSRIGLDAQTAFGLMSQYVDAGGRDIDQAGDVLHEFARITSEATDQAAEAFKGLGLNAEQMLADIHKGGEPAKEALTKTLGALRDIKDPAKQSALAVQLFGDMAGEGGDALWAMDPATAAASSGIDDVAGAADKANGAMEHSPAQTFSSLMRTLAGTIGDVLAPALQVVNEFLQNNPGLVQTLVPIILMLAVALGIAAIAQWAMNSAMLANPVTWVIVLIVALIAIVILLVTHWDTVKKALLAAWDAIKSGLAAGWHWMVNNVFSPIGDFFTKTIPGWVEKGVQWVVDKWNGLIDFVTGLPSRMWNAAMGMFDGLKEAFRDAVNWLIWKWNSFSITLGGGSILGMDIPSITLSTPNIPYLAEGGIATSSTLAMIGEGRESEAVLPLSKLGGMLGSVAGVRNTESHTDRIVIDVDGADGDMKRMIRKMVRTDGRGDVQIAFGRS